MVSADEGDHHYADHIRMHNEDDTYHSAHINLLYCHCLNKRVWGNGYQQIDPTTQLMEPIPYQNRGEQRCAPCPSGQVQDPYAAERCIFPTCPGQLQIKLPRDPLHCARCKSCEYPAFVPNSSKSKCVAYVASSYVATTITAHDHSVGSHSHDHNEMDVGHSHSEWMGNDHDHS